MQFAVIDSCPVPVQAAPMVARVKAASGETLNSCFRGEEAKALLKRLGKMDQPTLYWGYVNRLPGFNPANPPKNSPHECYSDGVSPPGYSRGTRIPDIMCGQDWSNGPRVISFYQSQGIPAYRPYMAGNEVQHVGMGKIPKTGVWLNVGMRDKKVIDLKRRLAFVPRPKKNGGRPYYTPDAAARKSNVFTDELEKAVKFFQRDHGMVGDGVVGPATWAQLSYSTAYWKKRKAARVAAAKKAKKR